MNLTNSFKIGLKDFWRFLQIDVKDVFYIFPKVQYTEEKRREMRKKAVVYVERHGNGNASLASGRYSTTEDIEDKRRKLGN